MIPPLVVTTYNAEWFFDNAEDDPEFAKHKIQALFPSDVFFFYYSVTAFRQQNLQKKANAIADLLANSESHIICLQEIKNEKVLFNFFSQVPAHQAVWQVLETLAKAFMERHNKSYKTFWSGVCSSRTQQSIGLLVESSVNVQVVV